MTLVRKLKPWISTFSGSIPLQNQHGDKIRVGGEIKSLFDTSKIFNFDSITVKGDKLNLGVHIGIDDSLGQIELIMSQKGYHLHDKVHHFKVGDVVIAEGKLYVDKKNKKDVHTVLTWKIEPLPEVTV